MLEADSRLISVGKNTERLVKLMDVTTQLYGEIYKAIEEVNGKRLVDDIFEERFADGFRSIFGGLRQSIGESVYETFSLKKNHQEDLIRI